MIMSGSTPSIAPEAVNKPTKPVVPHDSCYIHVAAAVIENRSGDILLARRPKHVHQGDLWEFPGGKVETGEDVTVALRRELEEELGIKVTHASPLIRIPHAYLDRQVLLDVWRVSGFEKLAHGAEGQIIRWVKRDRLRDYDFPAANRPIVTAAMLPPRYLVTPEPGGRNEWPRFLSRLEALMAGGIRLIQLRAKTLSGDDYWELAQKVISLGRAQGATILLNSTQEVACDLDADGLHLSASELRQLQQRPLAYDKWVAASCHNLEEIRYAMSIDVDFAVLSPLMPTTSHPGQRGIGWDAFHRLAEQSTIPLYALGGMREDDIETAWSYGGQGIASITALWQQPIT